MSIKPKNLEEKIGIILDELEKLPRAEASRKLTNFVMNELEWKNSTFVLDEQDLTSIRSFATRSMTDFSMAKMREYGFESSYGVDNDKMRALCWIEATVAFFRGKGMIPFTTDYKNYKGRK